ncbi:MAG TPA: hypothetical protein VH877_33425 [Polyangia bacterium]|jgi:hypothetical protein|nr:hypothetical protein [Polyangia bacterium]
MKTENLPATIPSNATSTVETPAVTGIPDTVTVNRGLPLVDPKLLPSPPDEFRLTPADDKRSMLKIPETQRAEYLASLSEAADKGPKLQVDLGRFAPPAEQAGAILQRANIVRAGKRRAQSLLSYYEELEDINNHDAMTFLSKVRGEFEHTAERLPQLKDEYPALVTLIGQRRDAILEGRARARAAEQTPAPGTGKNQ